MTTPHTIDSSTPKETALGLLEHECKSMLLAALLFTAGYFGSFTLVPDHQDGFAGMIALFGLLGVFGISVMVTLIYSVVSAIRYRSRSWAVLLAAPILYIGLPLLIGYTSGSELMGLHRDSYQEPVSAFEYSTPQPVPTATVIPRPTISSGSRNNNVAVPILYGSLQQYRSMRGLVIKSNPNFRNTFTGQREFVTTAINQFSGQTIGIYAVYTPDCAAKWPQPLATMSKALMAGNLPNGDDHCTGLQLSEPLKIGQAYIGIESTQTGSLVELAELPKLIDVITNAQPAWLSPQ